MAEKTGACTRLVCGHSEGALWGLACHPTSMLCCTASEDKSVRIWDLKQKVISRDGQYEI